MSKHTPGYTPGPWKVGKSVEDSLMIWSGAYPVAIVRDAHEKEANARLIAAAPELLEALKMAVKVGQKFLDAYGTEEYRETALAQCYEAIAKAEGRE